MAGPTILQPLLFSSWVLSQTLAQMLHVSRALLQTLIRDAALQVVSQRAMADITGAAVQALAFSLFSKVARRLQPTAHPSSNTAALAAVDGGASSAQEVCRQHNAQKSAFCFLYEHVATRHRHSDWSCSCSGAARAGFHPGALATVSCSRIIGRAARCSRCCSSRRQGGVSAHAALLLCVLAARRPTSGTGGNRRIWRAAAESAACRL